MSTITLYRCGRCNGLDCFTTFYPLPRRDPVSGEWYLTLTCMVCGYHGGVPCSSPDEAQAARDAGEPLPIVGRD
jgi:hypothetical protein